MSGIFFNEFDMLRLPWFMALFLAGFALAFGGLAVAISEGITRPACIEKADGLGVEAWWGSEPFWRFVLSPVCNHKGAWN